MPPPGPLGTLTYDDVDGICVSPPAQLRACTGPLPDPDIPNVAYTPATGFCVVGSPATNSICTGALPAPASETIDAFFSLGDGVCFEQPSAAPACTGRIAAWPTTTDQYCVDKDGEESVFGSHRNSSDYFTTNRGTWNTIRIYDRTIGHHCPNEPLDTVDTAHIVLNQVWGNWVEDGWGETVDSSGNHTFHWFTEYGAYGNVFGRDQGEKLCITPGADIMFRVRWDRNNVNPNYWIYDMNCINGTGWTGLGYVADALWNFGVSSGETSRYGYKWNGMKTYQHDLQVMDKNGNWNYYYSVKCSLDTAYNWDFGASSSTSYVTQGTKTNLCYNDLQP